jgi:hypothetical protein
MTKFHIGWKKNLCVKSDDPVEMAKLNLSLLEMVKADLKSGSIADWGSYCNGFSGYCLIEGTEADILPGLLKYMPHVLFNVRPVTNVDQNIEAINKVVAQSKTK